MKFFEDIVCLFRFIFLFFVVVFLLKHASSWKLLFLLDFCLRFPSGLKLLDKTEQIV